MLIRILVRAALRGRPLLKHVGSRVRLIRMLKSRREPGPNKEAARASPGGPRQRRRSDRQDDEPAV